MRRISTLLILSIFVGLMNLATMPFASPDHTQTLPSSEISGIHSHCNELQKIGKPSIEAKLNQSIDHFCCSIFAVIPIALLLTILSQKTTYLIRPLDKKISHIENSIYKPPKLCIV